MDEKDLTQQNIRTKFNSGLPLAKKTFSFSAVFWPPSGQPMILLFLVTLFFQFLTVSRATFLYFISLALFYLLLAYLLAAVIHEITRRKNFKPLLLLLFTLALRLPFLITPKGLIFTSDNALDALQTKEIASSHLPPFFLLNALQHMGTIKYMLAAFLWEIFGSHYLLYTLTQVLMTAGMLYCFYLIFGATKGKTTNWLWVFLLVGFSFIETWFDNSLSLRGGSEFEMAFFFFLGAALFGLKPDSGLHLFLAFYFSFFSIYLHTLGASFAASLTGTIIIVSLLQPYGKRRPGGVAWRHRFPFILLAAAGGFLGLFHWIYYRLFVPKPPSAGGWETFAIVLPSRISLELVRGWFQKARACFVNLFNYEFNYLLDFFKATGSRAELVFINRAIIFLSLLMLLLAIISAVRSAAFLLRKKISAHDGWPALFFLFLSLAFLTKTLLVEPPLLEPRHNFDLLTVIIFAYFIALPSFVRCFSCPITRLISSAKIRQQIISVVVTVCVLLGIAGTVPHYYLYLKMAKHKEELYRELLKSLYQNRIRYLATDFILTYPIHFLSNGRILVSDSLGPLTISQFFPQMREQVDKQPPENKAFLFFAEDYPSRPWHKEATAVIKARLLRDISQAGLSYKSIKIKYLLLILPRRPRGSSSPSPISPDFQVQTGHFSTHIEPSLLR